MTRDDTQARIGELRALFMRWAIVLVVLCVLALLAIRRLSIAAERLNATGQPDTTATATPAEPDIEYWTCTMHTEIRENGPGQCPICNMKLVAKYRNSDELGVPPKQPAPQTRTSTTQPFYRCSMPECGDTGSTDPTKPCPVCGMKRQRVDGGEAGGMYEITLNERARRLAEVATEPATPRFLYKRIRAVGRVGYDETRYKMASAWMGGRIEKLYADFTGMTVTKGDHLVEIYSPDLLSAQEEYLQAVRTAEANAQNSTDVARRSSEQVRTSARRKLELLGVTADQILSIEKSGQPQTHLVVHAPIGGTIIEKRAMEGMYVKTGDPLYTIADLTYLWLLVDLYEADLPWVKPFQQVRVTTQSLPGETFHGEIVFIEPKVDPQTRTIVVRIHVDNPGLRLKPDMWVTAEIDSAMGPGGRGAVPAPQGDFVCSMHPWDTADVAGPCSICGMARVRLENLPQYTSPTDPVPILSVSRGALMQTGERALVYVEKEVGRYRGAEVVVGPLSQDTNGQEYYPVLAGLASGDRVVMRGNFAIDSQMQLLGKHSLLSPLEAVEPGHEGHASLTTPEAHEPEDTGTTSQMEQTRCPVRSGSIDPEVFTEYRGERIYFCCPPCIEAFNSEPDKWIPELPQALQAKLGAGDSEGRSDDR